MNKIYLTIICFCVSFVATAQVTDPGLWTTPTYTTTAFSGANRDGYVSFVIGNKLYFGFGRDASNNYDSTIYEYDLTNLIATPVQYAPPASLNINGKRGATAFVINNKAYICGGISTFETTGNVWEFNPLGNQWRQMADYPGGHQGSIEGAVGIAYNGKGYMGTGHTYNFCTFNLCDSWHNDWYQFDPTAGSTGTWYVLPSFPGAIRSDGVCFEANGLIYVGLGYSAGCNKYGDFFAYDPLAGNWKASNFVPNYPGSTVAGASAFTLGNRWAFVCGGEVDSGSNGHCNTDYGSGATANYMFDAQLGYWVNTLTPAPIPTGLSFAAAATTPSAGYLIGGVNTSGQFLASIYRYSNNAIHDSIVASCHNTVASFTQLTDTVVINGSLTFTNTSTNANTYAWYYNGLQVGTTSNLTYDFNAVGHQTVQLIVSNGICVDSFSKQITVINPPCNNPVASFTQLSDTVLIHGSLTFINTSTNANSYAWYYNGLLVGTISDLTFIFNSVGQQTVQLIVSNGACVDSFSKQITVVSSAGINNIGVSDFVLYPNPVSNQLFISGNGFPVIEINIYDVTGNLITQSKKPQSKVMDVSNFSKGVYIAEIKTLEGSFRKRWVKM